MSSSPSTTVLHPASGLLILGLDWLLFSESIITLGLSTVVGAVFGFGAAMVGTGLIQWRCHGDGLMGIVWKALLAGLAVGIPLPIAGTAVGAAILGLSGLDRLWRRSDRERMSPPSPPSDDPS